METLPDNDLKPLSTAIDWINFTSDRLGSVNANDFCYEGGKFTEAKGVNSYTSCVMNALGARVMWAMKRKDMGVHTMYSGGTLNNYRDNDVSAVQIARWHRDNGARCTRIDIAIDVRDRRLKPGLLYAEVKVMGYKLPYGRKPKMVLSETGETLYIGSRTSDLFLRIYEKGGKNRSGEDWTRAELEVKGSRAMFFVNSLCETGELHAGTQARGVMKSIANFSNPTWQQVVGDERLTIAKADNRDKDTAKWLVSSVAPAMGKYMAQTGDIGVLTAFMEVVRTYAAGIDIDGVLGPNRRHGGEVSQIAGE